METKALPRYVTLLLDFMSLPPLLFKHTFSLILIKQSDLLCIYKQVSDVNNLC